MSDMTKGFRSMLAQAAAAKGKRPFYVTTFCNFAHWLDTGRPIDHECYVLPPAGLRKEMEAKDGEDIGDVYEKKGPIVKGRPLPKEYTDEEG